MKSATVVGAGVFGVASAIALVDQGWEVTLVDPGPLPHPLAASTDISKIIRADYGTDSLYIDLMEEAFPHWQAWNEAWGSDLYHQTGFLILSGAAMSPGSYEHASFTALESRGFPVEQVMASTVGERYPQWSLPAGVEGYVNGRAGWAESGAVVARLLADAAGVGVRLVETKVTDLMTRRSRVEGVVTEDGQRLLSDLTVVAAGAWTAGLVPDLDELIVTTGHPIVHFLPGEPERFRPPHFLPWAADIANTGWYGFPSSATGVLKVANHGAGRIIGPDEDRQIAEDWEAHFRGFLTEWLPAVAEAPIVDTRLCLYTDTTDGDFLIDRHPRLKSLVVATGGSGHGFKFAPVIGELVTDTIEHGPRYKRFGWRTAAAVKKEPARAVGHRPVKP
ncbi:MAG: FAD-dependent oxidoreductase [Acidimicrobiia bacterium]|nr:FAD-dependent oxidoreductase [Acidimicrobiia bacterium]